MVYSLITQFCMLLLDLVVVVGRSEPKKDLELLLLRQHLRILHRHRRRAPRISRTEKLFLAVLTAKCAQALTTMQAHLGDILLLFRPETVLKWHRQLVRRKWTFQCQPSPGRPRLAPEIAALILRLAQENPRWGYGKIQGELQKLGHRVARAPVQAVLQRQHVPPAPYRMQHGSSWRPFLNHYKHQILACDFFTVETLWLKTVYVLFFIELETRGATLIHGG